MARFTDKTADNYGNGGGGSFFTLKNDKDMATVRFMYNTLEDIEGFSVHQVEIGDRRRYVNCLREYGDPVEVCPLCEAKYKVMAKLFLNLYNEDTEQIQIWERGKKFYSELGALCTRINPLVSTPIEIERHGAKGDMSTVYKTWPTEKDDVTLDDLPEPDPILGGFILDKTAEEMNYFLDNGDFPEDSNGEPVRRRTSRRDVESDIESKRTEDEPPTRRTRRTSASNSRRGTDRF